MVALVGAFTFMAASGLAISQTTGKRVLAYSTIANLGLIIACAGINTPLSIAAAILLIIFHAVSKGLLFLCAGTIEHIVWSREIEDMEGLAAKAPMTTTIFAIGVLSMFLPPFGMLLGKWMALESAFTIPLAAWLFVIASAATIVFWAKWFGRLLAGIAEAGRQDREPVAQLHGTALGAGAGHLRRGHRGGPVLRRIHPECRGRRDRNPGSK